MDFATGLTTRERFLAMNEATHTGDIFGMPGRVIVALAGILLPLQALSGLLMWLRRGKILRTD
jgi:uncharacterized iron-regulated membrane protein